MKRFFRPRRAPAEVTGDASDAGKVSEEDRLDPVAIFREEGVASGWITRSASRLSDLLNAREPVAIRWSTDSEWQPLALDDVMAIAAPPTSGPAPNRMARRRHRLAFDAGPYRVDGTVHMPAGADPERYVHAASHRWLAVTDATIMLKDDSGYEVEVLLVNLDHVARGPRPDDDSRT